jgi:large subunit ribosomal protein L23
MQTSNPENIILGPIITEKSIAAQSNGVYAFWVSKNSNKHQIAVAFKEVFGTVPLDVHTISLQGKVKSDPRKRMDIQKPHRKRALITIAKDQKIESLNLNTK